MSPRRPRGPHIAYVCADRGVPVGGTKGASAHVDELTRALVARGAEVRILAARTAEDVEHVAAPVLDIGNERQVRRLRQSLMAEAGDERAQAAAAEAHALMVNQFIARRLESLHRSWRIDAIYERYSLWSFAAANFARGADLPFLLEVNAPLREEQRRYRILANPEAAKSLERFLLSSADHVLVPAAELRPHVVAHGAGARRVVVVPNAADPERYPPRQVGERTDDSFVIGFLGTLKPWHGIDHLLRAFRTLHRRDARYRLLIVGDGPLRETCEQRLSDDGLRHAATLTGEVAHAEVPAWLARMDVAVAPYPRLDGFYFSPLKVFEYMAAGVPIVASEIGQIGSLLHHGRNALLHPAGRIRDMVACIETLRADLRLRTRLAANARRLVERHYTWDHNAERVLKLLPPGSRKA